MAAIFQVRRGDSSNTSSLVNGELYLNNTENAFQVGTNSNPIKLLSLNTASFGDIILTGSAYISGNVVLGGTITIGDNAADSVIFNADLSSSIIPDATNTYDLGSTSKLYRNVYANNISASAITASLYGMGDPTTFSTSVDSRLDFLEGPFSTSVDSRMDLLENAMSGSNRLYVSPQGTDTTGSVPHGTEHNPFKTIKAAVESLYTNGVPNPSIQKRTTIFVGSGNYTEQNPIVVPPGVAIIGDNLRTVRLTASNPTKDYFHCHDGNYFYGLRFLNLQNPSFCFSYPCSTANTTISGGGVSAITLIHTESGYVNGETVKVIIEEPDVAGGVAATAIATVSGGTLLINIVSNGSGYVTGEKPHVSIQAPTTKRPIISTSPYIQNCSSITGPFLTDGITRIVPFSTGEANTVVRTTPYNYSDVDEQGAGGGIRIDGNLVSSISPLESFVADAFTQVNQGGPGHLVINNGYAQFVSCFTTFCTYGFKTANGGFANVSNSVIDFGKYGLISKTYFPTSYNTATSSVNLSSYLVSIQLDENGAGYTGSFAGVTIYGGGASVQAIATASVDANGSIREIVITNSGSGYTSKPTVDIDLATGPGAINATTIFGKGEISNIGQIPVKVTDISRSIDISSNMVLNGQNYLVVDVSGSGQDRLVSILNTEFHPAPASITSGSILNFHQLSNISTGNIVMEYVGSGVTYNALPKFGGIPLRTREVNEFAPGRVFYTSVDNIGNLKIGDYFSVNQLTGEVSITSDSFNLTGLNAIGPFKRNGFDAGVILQEVSNNTNLLNSVGLYGEDTVPTQFAVKGYIDIRDAKLNKLEISSASVNSFTASANGRLTNLETTSGSHNGRLTNLESKSASADISLAELNSYTSSLKTAITASGTNVTINGNLTVKGTTTQIDSTTLNIGDNIIELNYGGSQTLSGIYTKDATGALSSGSLLWNSTTDRWIAGVSGSESTILLAGGDGVLSGSTDFSAFSTSVDSRLDNLETSTGSLNTFSSSTLIRLGLLETSTGSLNTATASLYTSASLMTASISSLTSSVVALQAFSGNVNNRFAAVQTHTTSVNSRFEDLAIYTGSVNSKFTEIGVVSSSLILSASLVSSSVWHLHQFSSSQLEKDLTLAIYTGSVDGRFTSLATISGSLILSASAVSSSVWNLNLFSASVTTSLVRITASIVDHEERISYLYGVSGLGGGNPLLQLNLFSASIYTFTTSVNSRLSNIEAATSSYETVGRGIVSGSSQVTPLLPTGVISGSIQILGGTGIVSGSSQVTPLLPAGVVSGSAQTIANLPTGVVSGSAQTIANLPTGVVSGSAQTIANLPTGVVSGSAQTIANLPTGVVSGSSQVLGGTTIHSGSSGDYQFNSIGVGAAASTTAGEIRAIGDITAYYSSDIRLKENVVPIVNALTKVNQISGNTYDWKAGYDEIHSHKGNDVGVIAQEIEAILPQIVTNRDNGYKAVQYEKIIPLLIEAIKELSAKIDRLENK
jgi:hypothetical protein